MRRPFTATCSATLTAALVAALMTTSLLPPGRARAAGDPTRNMGIGGGRPTPSGVFSRGSSLTDLSAGLGTMVGSPGCAEPSFNVAPSFGVGDHPRSVTVGDFNLDGKPDLAVANGFPSNTVSVLLGDGLGDFARTDFEVGDRPRSVTVGDFNLDTKPDLATANENSDTVSVLINTCAAFVPATDLQVTKYGPPAALDGDRITYFFRVTNNGPNTATGVTLTDTLPAGVPLVSATPSTGACSGTSTVTCRFNDLPSGASDTVRIVVTPTTAGTITNTASVTANEPDSNLANNTSERSTTVVPLLLDLDPQTVSAACQNSITGTVRISDPAPAGGAVVTLASSNPAASVPASVTIPEGETSTTFAIPITAVSSARRGRVTAAFGGATFGRLLTVRPTNFPLSLVVSPSPVVGGNAVTATVTLSCAAAGDTLVTLSSSDPTVANPAAASILIPAGQSTGTFTIMTAEVAVVSYPVIRAAANGFNVKRQLRVKP